MLVYLAGPIDGIGDEFSRTWQRVVADLLPEWAVYSPAHAFAGTGSWSGVDTANRHVIAASDALIANLSGPGRAFGTVREVEFAKRFGKPVCVVGSEIAMHVCSWDLEVVSTFDQAADWLTGIARDTLD